MKELKSIFTNEMDRCLFTSLCVNIERHHVFGGTHRAKSEKYNFIVPLHRDIHPNGAFCRTKLWPDIDHWLKRKCQEFYIEVAHYGTRADWLREFGRFYDDRANEKVSIDKTFKWRL